jgi:hypothetical protein
MVGERMGLQVQCACTYGAHILADSLIHSLTHTHTKAPFAPEELQWGGVPHLPNFLVASRQLPPRLPLWRRGSADQEAAIAAAAGRVPGLQLPVSLLLSQRCTAALTAQAAVEGDAKDAERHINGIMRQQPLQDGSSSTDADWLAGIAR